MHHIFFDEPIFLIDKRLFRSYNLLPKRGNKFDKKKGSQKTQF